MASVQRANPGGQLAPEQIVGRDALVERLWQTLEGQSIQLVSERRTGKTHVIRKMDDHPPPGWKTKYFDLESIATAAEFAQAVSKGVEAHLTGMKRTGKRLKEFFTSIEHLEIPVVGRVALGSSSRSWKSLLTAAVEDLDSEKADVRLLLFFDELPYMLQNIVRNESEAVAMEVLDLLRSLRQTHSAFRMIVCGSVGLHHVLSGLRQAGHQNPAVNDLHTEELPPLAEEFATTLAASLIQGENLRVADLTVSAARLAGVACRWPFLIHCLAKRLSAGGDADPPHIDAATSALLTDDNDPLQFGHFRDRLKFYYPADADPAAVVLDSLCLAAQPMAVNDLLAEVKSAGQNVDRERLLNLVRLMARDHYLQRDEKGGLSLRLPLFARWWKLDRGL